MGFECKVNALLTLKSFHEPTYLLLSLEGTSCKTAYSRIKVNVRAHTHTVLQFVCVAQNEYNE